MYLFNKKKFIDFENYKYWITEVLDFGILNYLGTRFSS